MRGENRKTPQCENQGSRGIDLATQKNRQFGAERRSISPVIGVVLLVAVVVGGALTLATIGGGFLTDSEESLEDDTFRNDVERMVTTFDAVIRGNPQTDAIEFQSNAERNVNGGFEVTDDIGTVELIVNANDPDGNGGTTAFSDSVGGVIFSNDGEELQYKHGGIIDSGDDASVILPPYVDYESGADPTMVVRVVDVVNSAPLSDSATVSYRGSTDLYSSLQIASSQWVVYEFETDSPEAWANHFESTLETDVEVRTGSNSVRVAVQSSGDLVLHATHHELEVEP